MTRPLIIVGASLAGLRAAQAMRRAHYDGEVVVVGGEPHGPYTRPPLSKELLAGEHEAERCALPGADLQVQWQLGTHARGLDVERRELRLEGGDRLSYDKLLIATGARARAWPGDPLELDGLFTLRTLEDALAFRGALERRPRLAIIGAGFIGCEVAATARKRGLEDVTLIDVADHPMTALGPQLGRRCADLHRARGVRLQLGVGVDGFEGKRRLEAVRLMDGSRVEADVALIALGAQPNTEWLGESGLELQPGVVCDATLAVRDADGVFAAGDAAAWPHPMADGGVIRIEHWTNAAEQGAAAGRNMLLPPQDRKPYAAVPYFWSDQYEVKIQSVGLPARAERTHVLETAPDGERFVAVGERGGRVVAAVGFNAARRIVFYRSRLAAMPPLEELAAEVADDEKALGRVEVAA